MIEVAFESLLIALEDERGTAESTPTHLLNLEGKITPLQKHYTAKEARGTLAGKYRNQVVSRGGKWEGKGDADPNQLPLLLNMVLASLTTPSTPVGATAARLWTFTRAITADTIKSATSWWGDPAILKLLSDYCMIDELVIENNASNEGVASVDVKGMCGYPEGTSPPSVPASVIGDVLPGQLMQLWIDTSSAIGTTLAEGRLVSAKHIIPTGTSYKRVASGPTSTLDFTHTGRGKVVPKTELTLEVPDLTQYNQWNEAERLKVRVRHNGEEIESGFYNYLQVDMVGVFTAFDWGVNQNTNRTIKLTLEGEYDSTLSSDVRCSVQNARTTLA